MFVFSFKGLIHPARTADTKNASIGPAVQIISVHFVLDIVAFFTFSALADLLVPGSLVLEIRSFSFQVNYAW